MISMDIVVFKYNVIKSCPQAPTSDKSMWHQEFIIIYFFVSFVRIESIECICNNIQIVYVQIHEIPTLIGLETKKRRL